jgi:predicted outer membrane repeat protein
MGMLPKFNLARWFGNRLGTNPVRKGKRQATFLKPQLLCLEERVTPATYTVTNFGNSGTGTLRAAIDLANGTTANDTIVFDIGSSARTINLTSTLPSIEARGTAGKLEIVKQGSAILTLNGNSGGSNRDFRIFNIAAGGDFTLSGVTISGAQTSGSGAAIYNRGGIVSISDCVLTNNIAGEWGGAIRNGASENDGSELTLQRCTISNNTAADGGGISNHFGADVELYNSTLSGNTASDQGGAIYSRTTPGSANASTFTVGRSSVLKDNSAGLGGAISNRYGTLNVQGNSQIYGNNATDFGGAIYNHGTANITNATVRDNEAEDSGGGIHNNINGVLNITDSVITGNSVTKNNGVGGGIRSTGSTGSNHSDPKVTITNSQISDNHADGGSGDGGGIYADAYTILTIKGGSTISNNTAGRDGGGIYANGNTIVTIQGGSTISNNTAGRDGGGIYNNGLRLEVDSSTVSDNEADRDAGGIYSWHESKLAVNNSTISNNTSDGKGGGIFIDVGAGNYRNSVDNEIFYSNIFGNQAYQGGGIFNNGALYIYGSTIDSNIAHEEVISALSRSGDGGGIYSGNQGQLFVYDSTIRNNKADVDGGGIASYRDGGSINIPIPHKYFRILNTLTLGVNYLIDAFTPPEPFVIYNSTIAYNQAGKYGGGIYTISATGIFNCTIAYNQAETGGGLARRNYSPTAYETLTLENTISAFNQGDTAYVEGVTVDVGDYHSESGNPTDSKTFVSRLIVSDDSFSVYNSQNLFNNVGVIPRYYRNFYVDSDGDRVYSGDPILNPNHSGQIFGDNAINFIIADPHLGPLQDNGGPTFTMALLEHSPAIDRGNSVLSNSALDFGEVINRDQRGYNRVDGIPGGFTDRDIGAFEYQPLATTAKLLTSTSTTSAASSLKVYDPVTDTTTDVEDPFPGFTGKIHVASGDYNGDFNGDGIGDMVVGAGQGGGPVVAIIDSQTGRVITKFFAFDPAFRGGVELACLDFNLDGVMDILVGAGPGGGPHVKIFNGKDLGLLFSFYAYANDFTGGVSLCALDVNDDGIRDLVTGAGAGGAPHVKVWDGATHTLLSQWYAYDPAFRGGVNVSGGYLGSDGSVMVVTGAGAGMAPEVAVWDPLTREEISRFLAYSSQFMGGVRVRVHDGNGDGVSELVTAAGPGGAPHVKGFNFPALDLAFEFFAGNPTDTDGVAVS